MNSFMYTLSGLFFILIFLGGIRLMNSPKTAVLGNLLSASGMFGAIILTLYGSGIINISSLWIALGIGGILGYIMAVKVTMIKMPQMVALLNGLGGGASAGTAFVVIQSASHDFSTVFAAALALFVGGITFSGSLIASAKLDQKLSQRPILLRGHTSFGFFTLLSTSIFLLVMPFASEEVSGILACLILIGSLLFGMIFTIRIGGADMPITISLLNSLSGVAGSIAGFAINDPLLVATGAIVGSAGLILTRIMCRAMNRSLLEVLLGKTTSAGTAHPSHSLSLGHSQSDAALQTHENIKQPGSDKQSIATLLAAKAVIIVPGYGMALSQAQHQVKQLFDILEKKGKDVKFAIHPVAGRMPGHMNVLLAEADVPYEKLYEMDAMNPFFQDTDVVIIIGANDVVNPAATTAVGTPIFGMPILKVSEARNIMIFNKDTRPGYAGVDNPLFSQKRTSLFLGDAAEKIRELVEILNES